MDTVSIRSAIREARQHESTTRELERQLEDRLPTLDTTIRIPSPDPVRQLAIFVGNFVNRTPDMLDVVRERCASTEREDLAETLVCTCVDFFLMPPPLLAGNPGLCGAMGKAYVCHRVLEEASDSHLVASGLALVPLDFTRSNLVIHQLIGEPLANLLDELAHNTSDRMRHLCEVCGSSNPATLSETLPEQCRHWSYLDERVAPTMLPVKLMSTLRDEL